MTSTTKTYDKDEVIPRLWQGGVPPRGEYLRERGFDVLVLCAEEHQDASAYPGVRVVSAPMLDCHVVPVAVARRAAREVARLYERGAKVLVTCHQGWNRSGLVTALALRELGFGSGASCARRVKRHRPGSLCNRYFYEWLRALPEKT